MPTCRRKRVLLTEPSPLLLDAVKRDPTKDVFYLAQTGEVFESYEAYSARMSFYRLKQFQCEVTGKSGLNYFEALDSERAEARTMHSRFPEPLKSPILKAVQWQVIGRLDHLIEAVYERFKDRYFLDEKVFVDIQGERYYARVMQVFPPRTPTPNDGAASSSRLPEEEPIHKVASDLKLPTKDAIARDDPQKYLYKIQIHEENQEKDKAGGQASKSKWSGSLMEVQCGQMSRDRLTFSKSILRRFIRDCVDRDAAVASPWIVKKPIADRYGVTTVMPEETRKGVETIKKGEIEKRKKVWEEKDGPVSKKIKKDDPPLLDADGVPVVQEGPPKPPVEKKKKKPTRYPAEDLDVVLAEKDKKAGMKTQRPVPSRSALPFGTDFESFIMSWNFLVVYGAPLHLSPFTLDEFELAIRHPVSDPPCSLLGEVHSTLIYNLRTVPFTRHSALVSLLRLKDEGEAESYYGVSLDQLVAAMADVGNNWERVPLRHSEGRDGWEEALVGCIKDHASLEKFPLLQQVLTCLLFAPDTPPDSSDSGESSTSEPKNPPSPDLSEPSRPGDRYYSMPPEYKIAIISFMCQLSNASKAIHGHMEFCEEQLTSLRKEKIEVNRSKKQLTEEMNILMEGAEVKEAVNGSATPNSADPDVAMQDSSDLSDGGAPSEVASESGSTAGRTSTSRNQSLRRKAQTKSKQREASRTKSVSTRQAVAEHRRLDEEVNKLEKRLEAIEREFRKLLGCIRIKPFGRDRFFNRIWWFDGLGSGNLVGSSGGVQYGSGRIFIQGPSEFDADILERRELEDGDVEKRRLEEEGEDGMLGIGEWAVYSELEEIDEFLAWLNPKGVRENALKNSVNKWWSHIAPGVKKRLADMNVNAKLPDARRSARKSNGSAPEQSREPYMTWMNRRAVSNSA